MSKTERALLEALQGVFRKHARPSWFGIDETFHPFTFPPEWEKARIAIHDALAAEAVEPVG